MVAGRHRGLPDGDGSYLSSGGEHRAMMNSSLPTRDCFDEVCTSDRMMIGTQEQKESPEIKLEWPGDGGA